MRDKLHELLENCLPLYYVLLHPKRKRKVVCIKLGFSEITLMLRFDGVDGIKLLLIQRSSFSITGFIRYFWLIDITCYVWLLACGVFIGKFMLWTALGNQKTVSSQKNIEIKKNCKTPGAPTYSRCPHRKPGRCEAGFLKTTAVSGRLGNAGNH